MEDGQLLLFDNGNYHRTTPYSPPDDDANQGLYSRIVVFRVDEDAEHHDP